VGSLLCRAHQENDNQHDDIDSNAVIIAKTIIPALYFVRNSSIDSMTRSRSKNTMLVQSSSALMKALLFVATISHLSEAWRTIDDWATIVSSVYNLPDTCKSILTGMLLSEALSADPAVKTQVNEMNSVLNQTESIVPSIGLRQRRTPRNQILLWHRVLLK